MTINEFQHAYGTSRAKLLARGFRFVEGETNDEGTGYHPPSEWNGNKSGGYSLDLVPARCQQWNYGSPACHGVVAIYP